MYYTYNYPHSEDEPCRDHSWSIIEDRCVNCGQTREEARNSMPYDRKILKEYKLTDRHALCFHVWKEVGKSPFSNQPWINCERCDLAKEKWDRYQEALAKKDVI